MNSAMIKCADLDRELPLIPKGKHIPLYFDIKGRQLRVVDVTATRSTFELILNHPIDCPTPTTVFFKAGEDMARLAEIRQGTHLIFDLFPKWSVHPGESLHIREPKLKVGGPIFVNAELEKIEKVRKAGFDKWYLSYVEDWQEVNELQNLIGKDCEIRLKIESKAGLDFAVNKFKKRDNLSLTTARGDLYVEVERPHHIIKACEDIIRKDPDATVGSRMLLSLVKDSCPSCSDLGDLAWLYNLGYRRFLLCDELCLHEDMMARAVNVFEAFQETCG